MQLVVAVLSIVAFAAQSSYAAPVESLEVGASDHDEPFELELPEDPELGFVANGIRELANETELLHSWQAGRLLTEQKKPKRKFCNTSAYGLKGDYAYEACGAFCKQAKAVNHCKFCKCRACAFCTASQSTSLSTMMKKVKAKKQTDGASSTSLEPKKKKGKGLGKKGKKGKKKGTELA